MFNGINVWFKKIQILKRMAKLRHKLIFKHICKELDTPIIVCLVMCIRCKDIDQRWNILYLDNSIYIPDNGNRNLIHLISR